MNDCAALLSASGVRVRVARRTLVDALDIEMRPGEIMAVLGRNGTGKTLTLHTLAGLRAAAAGDVRLEGQAIASLPRRAVAQRLGVLFQDLDVGLSTTVLDAVLLGRHPHLAPWQWESDADHRLARDALVRVGLAGFESRQTATLSGGEQRRAALASLLAQAPSVFLLDEPTNHLDPHHQLAVFRLLRELADGGSAIIATVHDPSLAARFAHRVLLLFGDGRWRLLPAASLDEAALSELYLTPMAGALVEGTRVFVPR